MRLRRCQRWGLCDDWPVPGGDGSRLAAIGTAVGRMKCGSVCNGHAIEREAPWRALKQGALDRSHEESVTPVPTWMPGAF
jgi:hypothetical protein